MPAKRERTLNPAAYRVKEGEWVGIVSQDHIMECCDCGLLHRCNYRVVSDDVGQQQIQVQCFRIDLAEAQAIVAEHERRKQRERERL